MAKNEQNAKALAPRSAAPQAELTQEQPVVVPLTDIYETPDSVVVLAEMPGVEQKNVNVTFEDDVLTITGLTEADKPEGRELLYRGRQAGAFRREFRMLLDIVAAKISAKISNGVLRVVVPKAENAKPRKIEVQVA